MEWFGLDRTSKIILSQPPCYEQGHLPLKVLPCSFDGNHIRAGHRYFAHNRGLQFSCFSWTAASKRNEQVVYWYWDLENPWCAQHSASKPSDIWWCPRWHLEHRGIGEDHHSILESALGPAQRTCSITKPTEVSRNGIIMWRETRLKLPGQQPSFGEAAEVVSR